MSNEKRPPHCATMNIDRAPHAPTVQRKQTPFGMSKVAPPHPATMQHVVVQSKTAQERTPHPAAVQRNVSFGTTLTRTPHPATVIQRSASLSSIPNASAQGATVTLYGLPDIHTKTAARELAKQCLMKKQIAYFFIEYEHTARGNGDVPLNDILASLVKKKVSEEEAMKYFEAGNYFKKLSSTDAQPSLRELAAVAIGRGTRVLAADMDWEAAQVRVLEMGGYPSWISPAMINLSGATALEVRDNSASNFIAHVLAEYSPPNCECLLLWGEGHFDNEDGKSGLHEMIIKKFDQRVHERANGYLQHANSYNWHIKYLKL